MQKSVAWRIKFIDEMVIRNIRFYYLKIAEKKKSLGLLILFHYLFVIRHQLWNYYFLF